jgi:predicted site-specific integrase-resolvase
MVKQLLTEREAADQLRIAPKTLTRWRWAGKGPRFHKIGGAVRYSEADVLAFIAASGAGG